MWAAAQIAESVAERGRRRRARPTVLECVLAERMRHGTYTTTRRHRRHGQHNGELRRPRGLLSVLGEALRAGGGGGGMMRGPAHKAERTRPAVAAVFHRAAPQYATRNRSLRGATEATSQSGPAVE